MIWASVKPGSSSVISKMCRPGCQVRPLLFSFLGGMTASLLRSTSYQSAPAFCRSSRPGVADQVRFALRVCVGVVKVGALGRASPLRAVRGGKEYTWGVGRVERVGSGLRRACLRLRNAYALIIAFCVVCVGYAIYSFGEFI